MTDITVDQVITELVQEINQNDSSKKNSYLSEINCCSKYYILSIDNRTEPTFCCLCGRIIDKKIQS